MKRAWLMLPCFAVAASALGSVACGSPDASSPPAPLSHAKSAPASAYAAADRALRHDVAWAAAAAALCTQPGRSASCAAGATKDIAAAGTRAQTLRPKGVVADVLAQLPIKPIICAIVRKFQGSPGDDSSSDAGASAQDGGTEAMAPTTSSTFDMNGAFDNATTLDTNVVWDIERCQAAVFVNAKASSSIGALASLQGYRGPARGISAGVSEGGSGSFLLGGRSSNGTVRLRKTGSDLSLDVSSADAPRGLPAVDQAFVDALRTADGYVAWDAGTRALATFPTGRAPTIVSSGSATFVQYEADRDSSTECGTQMAVAKLVQADDQGDFSSSAGEGALASIASGVARSLGLDVGAWCGDAGGGNGQSGSSSGGPEPVLQDSCTNHDPSENYCGEASCAVNGNGLACCRSEPEGSIPCYGSDAQCPKDYVCSLKTKPAEDTGPVQVCVRPETCQR